MVRIYGEDAVVHQVGETAKFVQGVSGRRRWCRVELFGWGDSLSIGWNERGETIRKSANEEREQSKRTSDSPCPRMIPG